MQRFKTPNLPPSKHLRLILLCGFLLALYLTIFDYFYDLQSQTIEHHLAIVNNVAIRKPRALPTEATKSKLILFYTKFFKGHWLDYPRLGALRPPIFDGKFSFENCEVPWCEVTYDKGRIYEANAVGFHARDIPASFEFPTVRNPNQIWFYYVMENPSNVKLDYKILNNKFNWTMSYRQDSEIYIPYGAYREKTNPTNADKSYADGKTGFAVWMASNCMSDERNEYVANLMRYIPVTIYGKCSGKVCPLPRRSLECKHLLKKHKFYLSFENGNCVDYITEKYWENAIENDILPVVMGGADYNALAIPGSYIDVTKFSSPEKLADYLKYLDKNDTAYNEYFLWKGRYEQIAPRTACMLCKQVHNSSLIGKPRVYNDLEKFWGKQLCRRLNLVKSEKQSNNQIVPFSVKLENVMNFEKEKDKHSMNVTVTQPKHIPTKAPGRESFSANLKSHLEAPNELQTSGPDRRV